MGCFWSKEEKKNFYLSKIIGQRAETITFLALKQLRGENKITDFEKYDCYGTDFKIKYQDNIIKLQTKSSLAGAQYHQKKYPDIPVIIVHCSHLPSRRKTTLKKRVQSTKEKILAALSMVNSNERLILV